MNSRATRGQIFTWLLAPALAAAVAYGWSADDLSASAAASPAQDITRVEMRISQLEQRFRSVELSISRLEQQSRLPSITPGPPTRGDETAILRAEVEALRRRLAEVECGLIRIDERTLAPAARDGLRKSGAGGTDPCRLNSLAPLSLPSRP